MLKQNVTFFRLIPLLLIIQLFTGDIIAQNQEHYFKTVPLLTDNTPDWARMMYSENPNIWEVRDAYNAYYKQNEFVKTTHTQNYKYWIRSVESMVNEKGFISPVKRILPRQSPSIHKNDNSSDETKVIEVSCTLPEWTAIGPFETLKEGVVIQNHAYISSIDVCAANTNVAYVGTAGSVFKTTNKGVNWFPVSYEVNARGIHRVAVSPTDPDLVYFATHEGVWKSTNGGNTFSQVISMNSGEYTRILIHPTDNEIVYVGSLNGFFMTTNGGTTWTTKSTNKCWDIDFHPSNPSIVYTILTNPNDKIAEFWKSTDGTNFNKFSNGWYNSTDANRSDEGARIGVTPAAPNRVYVCLLGYSKASDNGWIGVYRSDNTGDSWVDTDGQNGAPYSAPNGSTPWNLGAYGGTDGYHQGYYNFDLAVSESNPDKLWIGTVQLCESNDGGVSFNSIAAGFNSTRHGNLHADIQEIVTVGGEVWVGNDGGVSYSNNELINHSIRNTGINATEFWGLGSGKQLDILVGGTYHNGNRAYRSSFPLGTYMWAGGVEEATGYIDANDNTIAHFSSYSKSYRIPNNYVATPSPVPTLGEFPNESYSSSYSSEVVYSYDNPAWVMLGKDNKFYKSSNNGASFTVTATFGNGKVLEIEQSQQNPQKLYLVFHNDDAPGGQRGEIHLTTNGGSSWTKTADLPGNHHQLEISINPQNDNELWVALHNNDATNKVLKTTNSGASWQDETSSELGNYRPFDILVVPPSASNPYTRAYLVCEDKVYYKGTSSATWIDISNELPYRFFPLQMAYYAPSQKLRMATKGHGIWELDISQNYDIAPVITSQPTNAFTCQGGAANLTVEAIGNGLTYQWQWSYNGVTAAGNAGESGNTTPTLSATNPNVYFRVVVTNSNGCSVASNFVQIISGNIDIQTESIDYTLCEVDSDIGVEVDTEGNYEMSLSNGFISNCNQIIPQSSNQTVADGNQLITDFCGATSGKYYTDIEVLTNCYNTTASFKGIIDLNNNTISVTEYLHFDMSTPSDVTGNGTATVESISAAFAKLRISLVNNSLFFAMTDAPCGGSSFLRITNGNIHQVPNLPISSADLPISAIVTIAGCTKTHPINVTNLQPVITSQPTNTLTCPGGGANLSVEAIGNGLTYQWQWSYNGVTANGNAGEPGNTTPTLIATNPNVYFRVVVTNSNGCSVASNFAQIIAGDIDIQTESADYTLCEGENLDIGVEVDAESNYELSLSNGFISNCNQIIPQSSNQTVADGNELITNFCGATSGKYYTDIEVLSSCYNTTASFKGIIDLDNNTINVTEYLHFNLNTPGDVTGNGTATVESISTAFARLRVSLINNSLFFAMTDAPCGGSSFLRISNGNIHQVQDAPISAADLPISAIITVDGCDQVHPVNVTFLVDSDNDGICDIFDICPEGNDNHIKDLEISVWLEGAYDSTLGEMSNTLATTRKLLPGQTPASVLSPPTPAGQPYSAAPWNYDGTEGTNWTDANYTGNETDWILASFRTGIEKSTQVGMTAGLLMKDGSITFLDRCALITTANPLYIVIEHRNHLGIMSPAPVDVINSTLTYDFRLSNSYRDATSFGQKQFPTGAWGMFAGDGDQSDFPSFDIKGTDKTLWLNNNGIFQQYSTPDFNLDGDINGADKVLWFENNGVSSRVPK